MEPYISQIPDENNCGAFSIAYYLWETEKAQFINEKAFVFEIHKKIQVGPNNIGIPEIYSSPEKMAKELSNSWHSYAYTCMISDSPLIPLARGLDISTEPINILDEIRAGDNKYAIIMCTVGHLTQVIHYMLVKYENGIYKLLDSLYNMDYATFKLIDSYGMHQVVWESFSLGTNDKLVIERNSNYYYTGVGILIK